MDAQASTALQALIDDACRSVAELRGDTHDPVELREGYRGQLDNIATALELAGLDELGAAATSLGERVARFATGDLAALREAGVRIERWACDLRGRLGAGGEVPPDNPPAATLDGDGDSGISPASARESTDADAPPAARPPSPPPDDDDGLLPSLGETFSTELAAVPLPSEHNARNIAAAQHTVAERMREACATRSIPALEETFAFLARNLTHAAQNADESLLALLERWPAIVHGYLLEPGESSALALVACVGDPAWPCPVDEDSAWLGALLEPPCVNGGAGAPGAVEQPSGPVEITDEDVSLGLPDDLQPEVLDAFYQEAPGQAATLSQSLSQMSQGRAVAANLRAAQRLAHTLKGVGHLIGALGVANLAHHLEDILDALVEHDADPPPALATVLLSAGDCMEAMVETLLGQAPAPPEARETLQEVVNWAQRCKTGDALLPQASADDAHSGGTTEAAPIEPDPALPPPVAPIAVAAESPDAQSVDTRYMRVPTASVDEMFRLAGEVTVVVGQIQDRVRALMEEGRTLREQDTVLQRHRLELENQVGVQSLAARQRNVQTGASDFDSLEMDRYDELYGTAHAFIESAVDLREMALDVQRQLHDLDGLMVNQRRMNTELQELILGARMVPVSTLGGRLQRTVRQAARTLARPVELVLEGDDLLLDNDVLRALADPLMHTLRNAVDHGIESPEARAAAGKPATGRIAMRFSQDGNFFLIEVTDDGGGIDYGAIRATALERGLIAADEEPGPAQLRRFLFAPGFSTRTATTQLSGRGVGMNVVHTALNDLQGSLEIADNQPCGCLVRMRLPVTLIANHCLVVLSAEARYAIPTRVLDQIVPPGGGSQHRAGAQAEFQFDDERYRLRHLHELLGRPDLAPDQGRTVMLVDVDDELLALTVDGVLESRDLVIKNLGRFVPSVPGVSGVSVLGDGAVVPVLDLPAMLRAPLPQPALALVETAGAEATLVNAPEVLIVDDSLSARRALSLLLGDAGYAVRVARDGLEALKLLEEKPADLVLADLEMPRMNGLELTAHLRSSEGFRDTPVIMITSRSLAKHRQSAERAGVSLYLTKPLSNDDLLQHLSRLGGRTTATV